jgi:hypothetical protein
VTLHLYCIWPEACFVRKACSYAWAEREETEVAKIVIADEEKRAVAFSERTLSGETPHEVKLIHDSSQLMQDLESGDLDVVFADVNILAIP